MKKDDDRIEKWNKDVIELLWTVFLSMVTAVIVTLLCKA